MTPHPIFLLDANVFIEAARRYYAFRIAPGYWDGLILHAGRGPVRSIVDTPTTKVEGFSLHRPELTPAVDAGTEDLISMSANSGVPHPTDPVEV
ncbi:MAG: DUF4411 family protein, partial [Methanoregula sp.]|nr:DUF4411 family protein [Methanoregula sp.]